jgi:hypothetical protein
MICDGAGGYSNAHQATLTGTGGYPCCAGAPGYGGGMDQYAGAFCAWALHPGRSVEEKFAMLLLVE